MAKDKLRNEVARSENKSDTFGHFFRYEEITEYLKGVADKHPDLVTLESAGKSSEGRDMWLVKVSNTRFKDSKPVIFMDANIHAREWISVMTTLNLIHKITEQHEEYPELLAVNWLIMPMVNPDGYEYSHTTDRMWRKTRSKNRNSQCQGTDANRNFDYKWDLGVSTSDDPCSDIFRGPHAESEPEVKVISEVLRKNKDRIKLYVAVHSYGEYVLIPWGYQVGLAHPNKANLTELGSKVSDAIAAINPVRNYNVGSAADLLYPASGASDDFAAGAAGIDLVYTFELSGSNGFIVDPNEIQSIANEVFAGFRELAKWFSKN